MHPWWVILSGWNVLKECKWLWTDGRELGVKEQKRDWRSHRRGHRGLRGTQRKLIMALRARVRPRIRIGAGNVLWRLEQAVGLEFREAASVFGSQHSGKEDPKEGSGSQALATEKALDTKLTFQFSLEFYTCHVRSVAGVSCLKVPV